MTEKLYTVRKNARIPHGMAEKFSAVRESALIQHGEGGRWCRNYFLTGIFNFIPGLMLEEMLLILMMSLADTPGYLWAIL